MKRNFSIHLLVNHTDSVSRPQSITLSPSTLNSIYAFPLPTGASTTAPKSPNATPFSSTGVIPPYDPSQSLRSMTTSPHSSVGQIPAYDPALASLTDSQVSAIALQQAYIIDFV